MTDTPRRSPASPRGHLASGTGTAPSPGRGSPSLLTRILATPNLEAQIQTLPAPVFSKLVGRIGLEDAGELIALATKPQIVELLDEEIWRSSRPGRDEIFDPARFRVWLSVLLEGGDALVAERLHDLPEDLVALGLHRQMLVLRIDALLEQGEREAHGVEKRLEGRLVEEIEGYLLVARVEDGWDDVFAAILALDRTHHEFLVRILDRCCRTSGSEIEESGGLERALTLAESLEEDVAGDRDDRRAEAGYIAPADAAEFLRLARKPEGTPSRDPLTKAYFRRRRAESDAPTATAPEQALVPSHDLMELLLEAEVLERDAPVLLLEGPEDAGSGEEPLLIAAMRRLAQDEAAALSTCAEEIAYLGNVLVAGCSLAGRRLSQREAADAVIATCSLGLDLVAGGDGDVAVAAEVLHRQGADRLFRRAWAYVSAEVVEPAVALAVRLLEAAAASEEGAEASALRRAMRRLKKASVAGAPWTGLEAVDSLLGKVDDDVVETLRGLIDQCPSLRGRLAAEATPRFIARMSEVEAIRSFLRRAWRDSVGS